MNDYYDMIEYERPDWTPSEMSEREPPFTFAAATQTQARAKRQRKGIGAIPAMLIIAGVVWGFFWLLGAAT